MKTKVVVTAIIEYKGKILMGKKPKDKGPYPNAWHLPGGKVEEDERILDAVKREIKEETGLEVKSIKRVGFDDDIEANKTGELTHYIFLVFKCESTRLQAIPGDDIVKLKWFSKSDFKNIPLTRPSEKYFKEIGWI